MEGNFFGIAQKPKIMPVFHRDIKLIMLALASWPAFIKMLREHGSGRKFSPPLSGYKGMFRLRRKLLLRKIVSFNGKIYSTPTIPSFPSHAFIEMFNKGGLNVLHAGTDKKKQTDSVFLAITNKCALRCEHCYEKHNLNSAMDIPAEKWTEIINAMQKRGVNVFILTGGEPLLAFDKLLYILRTSNKNLSEFHIHTSGNSLTREKVRMLKEAGLSAAAVGLDHFMEEKHNRIRGEGSFEDAVNALRMFNEEGIMTYVNFCAGKEIISGSGLYEYYEFVKQLNVSIVQLLEPRPCGGYFNADKEVWLDGDERYKLKEFTRRGNAEMQFLNYPVIYYVAHIEGREQLGCHMGGLSHMYIDSAGNVCPCVFFPVKYGNVAHDAIDHIYDKMRKNIPRPIHNTCPSVLLSDKISDAYNDHHEMPVSHEYMQNDIKKLYLKEEQ